MRNSLEKNCFCNDPSTATLASRHPLPKFGVVFMIVLAFIQAAYGNAFAAIEFWLALFLAAATTESAGDDHADDMQIESEKAGFARRFL